MPAQSSFGSSTRVGTPRQDSPSALRLRWSGGAGREDASGHVIHGSVQHRRVDSRLPADEGATNEPATQPKNHQRAPEFRIGRSTPRRAIRPTTQSPKNKQTASACLIGHIWGFVAASAAVVALPCIFRAFLRRRLTALLADRTGSASSASGLTRPRHSLSISNARVATAPLANLLALGRTGVA